MVKHHVPANIQANIGSLDSITYQNNGTDRLKGSFPHLILNCKTIVEHLNQIISTKHLYNNGVFSRISSRYFIVSTETENCKKMFENLKIGDFTFKLEASIPLSNYVSPEGFQLTWIWIGGNVEERTISTSTKQLILQKLSNAKNNIQELTYDPNSDYEYTILTSNKIAMKENNVSIRKITSGDALAIVKLYKDRLPVYVADNSDSHYIQNIVTNSQDTTLFVATHKKNKSIDAVIANEFANYPLILPDNKTTTICVCESNDWVKSKNMSRKEFLLFLQATLEDAKSHNPHIIETECVPEAITAAYSVNFSFAGILERTSHMQTDGKNMELYDEETPEEYRRFNSLLLFYLNQ